MYKKKVEAGEVRDAQGRRRFHGAFTGGTGAVAGSRIPGLGRRSSRQHQTEGQRRQVYSEESPGRHPAP